MEQKAKHLQSLLLLLLMTVMGTANMWADVVDNFTLMSATDGNYCYITPTDVNPANAAQRWKIAKGGSITVTAKTGYKIKSITFGWRAAAYQPSSTDVWVPTAGTLSSITSWSAGTAVETVTFINNDTKELHLEGANCIAVTLESYSAAFTVTFNGNGHGTPGEESLKEASIGSGVTLPSCTADAPADWTQYTFLGWSTDPNATSADAGAAAGDTYYPDKDITLYAVYSVAYQLFSAVTPEGKGTISMKVGSSSGATINSGDYIADGTHIWAEATATPNSGYKAANTSWVGTSATGNPVDFNMGNAGKTLGYTFSPIAYEVAFDKNGGTGSMENQDFTYDTAQNLTANTFTKDGSDFKEWNTQSDGNGTSYANGAEVSNLTTTDGATVTLYAQWEGQKKLTAITLNHNAGTIKVGENLNLSVATWTPSDATNKSVTWSSSDASKATVDAETGVVTGVAVGNATITATANDGSNVTATCTVTVQAAPNANTAIFSTDFSDSAWSGITSICNSSKAANETHNGITFHSYNDNARPFTINQSTGTMTWCNNNMGDKYWIAIPVTGVNGALTISVYNENSNTNFYYDVKKETSISGHTGSGTSATSGNPATATISNLDGSDYVVYLGRNGSGNTTVTSITISTPTTKLAATPASVTILRTGNSETVDVETNSEGAITYSLADASIANAAYNSTTKKLTITSKAIGATTLTLRVAADDTHPAKSIDIPVSVENPAITIGPQPADLSFTQGDTDAQTFSVAATVNTGNELTYQWYKNNTSDATADDEHKIAGATSATYALTATEKNTVGTSYYYCVVKSETDELSKTSSVATLTVNALAGGGTYAPTVYINKSISYTGLSEWSIDSENTTSDHSTHTLSEGTLTITGNTEGSDVIQLTKSEEVITINVTVKKQKVTITWSAEKKDFSTPPSKDAAFTGLPTYTATNEDGTAYTGDIMFYTDDQSVAYFKAGTQKVNFSLSYNPNQIYYGGAQGGAKIYAYIQADEEMESVKASYDLTVQQGIRNTLPKSETIHPQDQYTLWNGDTKLITVTYGGYKYANNKLQGCKEADSWDDPSNLVKREDNAIDGFIDATVNMQNDALNEKGVMVTVDKTKTDVWPETNRLNVFSLPVAGSYITFEAHESGTLTAYVYQNGIIGRKGDDGTLATNPRVAYWIDQEGNLQEPTYVVSKTVLPNKYNVDSGNTTGRDTNNYKHNEEDIDGDEVKELARCLEAWNEVEDYKALVKMLTSKRCKKSNLPNDKSTQTQSIDDYGDEPGTYPFVNPYYWGTQEEVEANNLKALPDPIRPLPFNGGHLMLHRSYVKYVLPVVAGKTYYFFGSGTKVGYVGMNFYQQDNSNYNIESTRQHFDNSTNLVEFASNQEKPTLYREMTVPSNFRLNTWNTICLPFNVTENQVKEVFGNDTQLAIYDGLEQSPTVSDCYIIKYLRHVDQNILAGQPYLIYPTGKEVEKQSNQDGGKYVETGNTLPTVEVSGQQVLGSTGLKDDDTTTPRLLFKNVLINKDFAAKSYGSDVDKTSDDTKLDHSYYLFTPTTAPTTIEQYSWYINVKNGNFTRYTGTTGNATLNTFHAYIKPNPDYSSIVNQLSFDGAFMDDMVNIIENGEGAEPTAIIEIDGNAVNVANVKRPANGKAYNIMGQQVDANTTKGLVIVNGKKYMMK